MMTNSDLPRIINSDEVQCKVVPAKTQSKFRRIKKNPLKNLGVMVKLNPYAMKQKRQARAGEAGKKAMKRTSAQKKASKASSPRCLLKLVLFGHCQLRARWLLLLVMVCV